MDVLAVTSTGYGGRVCFLDEGNLCYASGHGVIIHDKETGMQKHIWALTEGQGHPPPNMCPATFATCPGGHLLAYVQQGGQQQQIQVVQQETLLPASTIKDPGARYLEFTQLVFDSEGTRLASLGAPPDNQLDVWDVDMKESLLRVALPDSLTGLEPAFFPLNSQVLALGGPDAVRLVWEEPLAGSRVVRQSDVDLAVLVEGELLNCMAWTPNGTLLLGTTAGRVLGVKGAAPPAIPTCSWGEHPGGGHAAELLYGATAASVPPPLVCLPPPNSAVPPPPPGAAAAALPASLLVGPATPRTGVVTIVVTATHILLVMGGDATTSAELLWLSPQSMHALASAPLPLTTLIRAAVSPSYEQLAIAAADGSISVCSTICPIPGISLARLTGDGTSAISLLAAPSSVANGGGGETVVTAQSPAGEHRTSRVSGSHYSGGGFAAAAAAATAAAAMAAAAAAVPGRVERGALVPVTEVARFHRGRVSSCLWLSPTRIVTGGMDGTVRMWSYVPHDADPPDRAAWLCPGLQLDAQWNISQSVTCLAALNPPLPTGVDWPSLSGSGGSTGDGGGGGGGGGADFAATWAASAPKPPAFIIGSACGVVQLVNADRVPQQIADAQDLAQLKASLQTTWDVRIFSGAVSAAAFSQDGRFCALSCVSEGLVAFLRVMVLGHELSMRLLGFYPMRDPRILAWAPPEPGGIHPLLVVGSILGEVVVLGLPDSSALEDGPSDGVLPRGSLLRASMRCQSHVTSLLVYPLPATELRGGGHFWIITSHADKSIRRYRLYTDQQKAAAAVLVRAAALAAAAANDGGANSSGAAGVVSGAGANARRASAVIQPMTRSSMVGPGANQNFLTPEAEKPMELQLPCNAMSISLLPHGGGGGGGGGGAGGGGYGSTPLRMAIASSDGSVALYGMPELVLQGRWLLHEMAAGGAMTVCLLGDRILSAGGEGTFQVLEVMSVAARARHRVSHLGNAGGFPAVNASALTAASGAASTTAAAGGGGGGGRSGTAVAQRSTFFQPVGPPRPRGMERASLGSVLPVHLQSVLPVTYTNADAAPTWQEARAQATRELYREQLTSFRKKAQARCQEWMDKVKELHVINNAADEVERLTPQEFVIDTGLRKGLLGEAEARYARVKALVDREMRLMEFRRQRLREECLMGVDVISRPLLPLGDYTFVSPMDAMEARKYKLEGEAAPGRTEGGVWSYGLCKVKPAQELRLRQVSFLRKVEQAEVALRTSMERGAVVPLRRYKGDMQRKYTLISPEEEQGQPLSGQASGFAAQQGHGGSTTRGAAPQPPQPQGVLSGTYDDEGDEGEDGQSISGTSMKGGKRARDDGFEGTELGYGETGLMYADVQLYTHCRRASQLVFIKEEIRCLRRMFNVKWAAFRTAKQKVLDRIDERLGRIVEIHKELTKLALEEGAGEPPPPAPQHMPGEFYTWQPEEEGVALTPVRDNEVQAPRYVSPEELARRAAEAAAEAEERRRAEADDARNRALKEMMNSNPAINRKVKGGKHRLVREGWMDLQPGQLTKDQRLKLAEWERKQQELAEELEKQRRLLEAERRALEVEIAELAAGINTDLTRLAGSKVRMDMEIVHLEWKAAELADRVLSLVSARQTRAALTAQLTANTTRRNRRSPLLAVLEARVAAAQKAYQDIALAEKQVDKAFRREYISRPELWDDAQKVYRTRAHLLTGSISTASLHVNANGGSGAGTAGRDTTANGGVVTTARLPRKTAMELLAKCPEGAALAAVLDVPGPGDVSQSQSTNSVPMLSRQGTANNRGNNRLMTLDSIGGASGTGSAGLTNPDVLLTTPRRPMRDMAHVARPLPRPGSALQAFLQKHLEPARMHAEGGGGGGAAADPPLAPPRPRHGIGAVLAMASDETALARRGISHRSSGQRLRALVEKEGRLLERLLQMVAEGLPASVICAELGPLGLRLGSNSPGNFNPFRIEGPLAIFNPEVAGAAEALGDTRGGGSSGGSIAGGGGTSPVRERSSASGGRSTNNGSMSPARAEDGAGEADEEEQDPLDSKERPEGMDDALWIRLLEFRQTRADLEMEAEESWRRVSLLTAQLDWLEAEDSVMEAQVEEAGARAAALRDGSTRLSLDVSLTYHLKNGQVELPERPGDVVGAGAVLADALMLHRNRVETLNEEVLSRGDNKIEVLDELRLMRRKIHLTQWEMDAAEMGGQHAAQRLTELQLLHVTKDLQAALRDPTIVDRLHEEDRLLSVRQNIANLHSHKMDQRRRQLASLRARVSRSGTEQGELSVAEAAAEAAFQESTRMHLMMSHSKVTEDASHRRHMRAIVTNAQLRAIAQQQAADLERLADALGSAQARNFPALQPTNAWTPPDYRPTSAGMSSGFGLGSGSRVQSRGADGGGGLSGVSRPVSPVTPSGGGGGGQQQRRVSNGIGGGVGGLGSRAGTPPVPPRSGSALGLTRSGGAGATLTRAYTLAAGGVGGGITSGGGGGGTAGDSFTATSMSSRPPSGMPLRPSTSMLRRQ